MAWNGIICTKLSHDRPARPRDGDFPPAGWTVGRLIRLRGQDDGKRLWCCAVVAMPGDPVEGDAYMTWTTVTELNRDYADH